jgi:CheY-like chemotaxis protein
MLVGMTRILLVEDCADVLCVLQMELEWMGYKVDAEADAEAAIETAQRNRPDVIVSDLRMPGMDGFELIKRIREIPQLTSVPAIALTGTTFNSDVQQALAFGFASHITKPVDPAELAEKIQQLATPRLQRQTS